MAEVMRDDATLAQIRAADPEASTWLGANAGSGKTRVLTDRVARLLLRGVEPDHILCLTFTKAAASEMQNRLFNRLGDWAMLPDVALRRQLEELGLPPGALDPAFLGRARTLFARAIETPGGLRIQTIHAFCAAILRRFPLEAGVSPQFQEIEDRAAQLLRQEVLDEMAAGRDASLVEAIAMIAPANPLEELAAAIVSKRPGFQPPRDETALRSLYGLSPDATEAELLSRVFLPGDIAFLAELVPVLSAAGGNDARLGQALARVTAPDMEGLAILESAFLTKSGATPYCARIGKIPNKATREGPLAASMDRLENLMRRVEAARETRVALAALARDTVLHRFAGTFLARFEAAKEARGWLDFDDLILRTRALLSDPGVAAWVLYRLDGGIDHILVDEAQDTSPAQWDVIEKLAQEFTSGEGARADRRRTIFVVGDKKQSIYSFQGADPTEFDRMRKAFRDRLRDTDAPLQDGQLNFSFRSSDAILRLVDHVFDGRHEAGFLPDQSHISFHSDVPGRVDLWPHVPKAEEDDAGLDWDMPVNRVGPRHHDVVLAKRIAAFIRRTIDAGTSLPLGRDAQGRLETRAVHAGDFLILVRRRSRLFHEILRACKAQNLPIAGADRLRVMAELAVRDLQALLNFLSTPEDSLALACALRSPLFGLDEQALFTLAHRRKSPYLWEELRRHRDAFPEIWRILTDLRAQVDFLRPYDLLERILIRHQGRERLIGRLGEEAEDGIDALLSQALAYEQTEVPSLTGFLHWMQTDDLEIKRAADSAGSRVRVMTIHGAKGLEAPIVILPDTHSTRKSRPETLVDVEGVVHWRAPKDQQPALHRAAEARREAAEEQERDRLLYVAMTRAERWLVVAAAGTLSKDASAWYDRIRNGLAQCGATARDFAFEDAEAGQGLRLEYPAWPADSTGTPPPAGARALDLPDWALRPAPQGAASPLVLSPSDLGGAKALPGAEGDTGDVAKARGTLLHLLLETLPQLPSEAQEEAARALLARAETPPGEPDALVAEAMHVLQAPQVAGFFAPDVPAEVSLSAPMPGTSHMLMGTIDRLIVEPEKVTAIDIKSNRTVPARPENCPEGILRQMGAYNAMLRALYPEHKVETGIVWTANASWMPLPETLVAQALVRARDLDGPRVPS